MQSNPNRPRPEGLTRALGEFTEGRLPSWVLIGVVIPAAYLCFSLGAILSFAELPEGFDYGSCVISRLCSSYHNPRGYPYLTFGLIGLATLLLPFPAWLSREVGGCPRLCLWGRRTFSVGLAATAMIGVERGLCPTHWTRYEIAHLILAGVAFSCLWLGQAMIAGAAGPPGVPRVRWVWLFRPPWYLAVSVLPIGVIFGMYLPLNIVPNAHSRLMTAWPRELVFLRTTTFWQWYLTAGLLSSLVVLTNRVHRQARYRPTNLGSWRIDGRQISVPIGRPSTQKLMTTRPRPTSTATRFQTAGSPSQEGPDTCSTATDRAA